jgi:hypothetical protein
MKIQIVIILGLFTFDYCEDLNCYDCDPKSEGECVTPNKHNVKITNCRDIPIFAPNITKQNSNTDQQKIEPQNVEVVSLCVSMYQENGE